MFALLVAVVVLAGVALHGWTLLRARDQQARIGASLDTLAHRLSTRATDVTRERDRLLNALAGTVAPAFALTELGGGRLTLDALLAPGNPLLLVVTDPRCGPCYELLPDIGGWQRIYGDRLTIALVSTGEPKTNLAMTAEYDIRPVLLQQGSELVEAYELAQAPAAVLIQPDGRISAGPRYGTKAIRQLVAETLGLVVPAPPTHNVQTATLGQPAPRLRRPDLNGHAVELGGATSTPTLLLFWSPGCNHCRDLLPLIRAYERATERPRLVIVSRGPVALNQEVGFAAPVVLDDDRALAQVFGVSGTPAAVLLDGRGIVATEVVRGAGGVRALLSAGLVPSRVAG